MRRARIIPVHRPGHTAVHRASPGAKLSLLAAVAVAVVGLRGDGGTGLPLALGAVVLASAVAGHGYVRTPPRVLAGAVARAAPGIVLIAAYQGFTRGWPVGTEIALDLSGLVVLAALVTVTTPLDRMFDTLAKATVPLRLVPGLRHAVTPERVAFTFTLTLRSIDVLWDCAADARDAARARGRGRDVRAVVTPTVLRAVAHARATGDALAARGLLD